MTWKRDVFEVQISVSIIEIGKTLHVIFYLVQLYFFCNLLHCPFHLFHAKSFFYCEYVFPFLAIYNLQVKMFYLRPFVHGSI